MPPQIEESKGGVGVGSDLIRFYLRENTVSEAKKGTLIVEECRSHQITVATCIKEIRDRQELTST